MYEFPNLINDFALFTNTYSQCNWYCDSESKFYLYFPLHLNISQRLVLIKIKKKKLSI